MAINFNKADFVLSAVKASTFIRDGRPQVTFAGRSNVGKSSVINRLLNRKNFARVGATPGKTSQINYFLIDDKIYFTDLPGYGYAKVSTAEKRRWQELIGGYFAADRDMRLVMQLVDMRHDPTADDRQMIDFMVEEGIPFMVVLTKADKLNKTEFTRRAEAFDAFFADYEGIRYLPFSAVDGRGVEELRKILVSVTEDA